MNPIRVVLAEASAVARRIIVDAFAQAVEFDLVAVAPDGRQALTAVDTHRPDVVVLDGDMPSMDGTEALRELRSRYPRMPVVMFSAAQKGAAATLEALALGAADYVTKPSTPSDVRAMVHALEHDLLPCLSALVRRPALLGTFPPAASRATRFRVNHAFHVELVVVGASMGGPLAVIQLIRQLPVDYAIPVVVVQHMPRLFTKRFAAQLGEEVAPPVKEVDDGDVLDRGGVWIARGGRHVEVVNRPEGLRLRLTEGEPVHFCRPSVDVLFRSAAACCGPGTLGVVLTGMGRDGLEGSRMIVSAGGSVIAQDEQSSVMWGMPGRVVQAGVASFLGDPERLGRRVAAAEAAAPAFDP